MWATLRRGVAAGTVVGLLYGLFTAAVVHPLTAGFAELGHHGHSHAGEQGHVVSETTTALVSVGGGVLWGIALGAAFGLSYYFLEPALPGTVAVRPYVLAAGGFLSVSGAPWLVLPPVAPGMDHQLAVSTRVQLYAGMMLVGVALTALAVLVYRRFGTRDPRRGVVAGLTPVVAVALVAVAFGPTTATSGTLSPELVAAYRGLVVFGQVGLWAGLAGTFQYFETSRRLGIETHETQV